MPISPETNAVPPRSRTPLKLLGVLIIGIVSAAVLLVHSSTANQSPDDSAAPQLPVGGNVAGTIVAQHDTVMQETATTPPAWAEVTPTAEQIQAVTPTHPPTDAFGARHALADSQMELNPTSTSLPGDGTGGATPTSGAPWDAPGGEPDDVSGHVLFPTTR